SLHINCLIYIERCIVHLRFLSFASVDQRFSFSYRVCFQSARDIVRMFRLLRTDHPWILPRLRATSSLRALLLASAIFLLDVCSGVEIRDLPGQRPEMLEAWRLLGRMEEDSNLVDQFLDFARQMLAKYHVSDAIVSALAAAAAAATASASYASSADESPLRDRDRDRDHHHHHHHRHDYPAPLPHHQPGMAAPVDDLPVDATQRWQTLDADFDIKTMSWDNVLWGFDSVLM
ncbi:hypothetical protein E4U41_005528, partial [Claviceps citrina]